MVHLTLSVAQRPIISLANNKLISRILFLLLVHVYLREKKTVELKILLILRAKSNVVVTSGTTSEMLLNKLNDEKK